MFLVIAVSVEHAIEVYSVTLLLQTSRVFGEVADC